jgi:4-hydroxybenzoate polyprenyltransferase
MIALCSALICLAGWMILSKDDSFAGFPPRIVLTILVACTVAFGFKDIKDFQGDEKTGAMTIPTILGERWGKRVMGVLAILAYLSVPLILECYAVMPIALVFGIGTYFLINRQHMRETPVFISYFLFLGVVMYFISNQIRDGSFHLHG